MTEAQQPDGQGFRILGTSFDPGIAEERQKQNAARRTLLVGGIEVGVNPLPLGDTFVPGVLSYQQGDARICFVAGIVAGSTKFTEREPARVAEQALTRILESEGLLGPQGVLTTSDKNIARVTAIVQGQTGTELEQFLPPGRTPHYQSLGESIPTAIENGNPLLINQGHHWVVLDGISRESVSHTSLMTMDPVHGRRGRMSPARLAELLLPDTGATPHFIIKPHRPSFEIVQRTGRV